ncbi:MAG: pyridoxal 5'-phosphate synthase glutaminase subunit PdxT [Firmicutes bacterium]|nr:pyridoxal 5'-phosphate synthase glutaminase subunit PdxT [Bacillota bacterium]
MTATSEANGATVGVLNVQGAVSEHMDAVHAAGGKALAVKQPADLSRVDALIIPGGESTTIGRLIRRYELFEPIRERAAAGMPVFGTCAGMILLAKRLVTDEEPHLGLLDAVVNRNSFGRQRESFEADVDVVGLDGGPFSAVFIRAPHAETVGTDVEVLATYDNRIVAVRQGAILATSFHPELTPDVRMHRLFLDMIA